MNAENTPVDPRNFTTAATRFDEALSAYRAASARVDDAQAALEALECRAPFAYAVTGPDGEEDEYVIDAKCTYSQGHAGEHREDFDESDAAPDNYAQALARFRDEANRATDLREDWEDADEALDELRCNHGGRGEWPCVLRRGHDVAHVHPSEMLSLIHI